jgi:hypothetical protein
MRRKHFWKDVMELNSVIIQCPSQADRRVPWERVGRDFPPRGEGYSGWDVKLTITSIECWVTNECSYASTTSYAFMDCSWRFLSRGEDGKNRMSSSHLYTQLGAAYPAIDRPLFALATRQLNPSAKKLRSSSCKYSFLQTKWGLRNFPRSQYVTWQRSVMEY